MKRGRGKKSARRAGARTAQARADAGEKISQLWYVAEGKRGQQLLDQGQVGQATEVFAAILARLGDGPSYGRAVILGRLGRCFHMAEQPELAIAQLQDAMGISEQLAPSDGVKALRGTLHAEFGNVLRATGRYREARQAYEAALTISEELHDLRGQGIDLGQLGALALAEGQLERALTRYRAALQLFQQIHEPALEAVVRHQLGRVFQEQRQWDEAERHYREAAHIREERGDLAGATQTWNQLALLCQEAGQPEAAETWYRRAIGVRSETHSPANGVGLPLTLEVTLHEELITEYVFEPDLLIDGRREQRIIRWTGEPDFLAEDVRPMLIPCARNYMDDEGAVRVCLPQGEPIVERHPDCTVMRRVRREVAVSGNPGVFWRVIRRMDGTCTVAEILSGLPPDQRPVATRLLTALVATGAIDVSGRPIGRFLHSATKKGVLPAGGLEGEQVLFLATDGNYRTYPGARRVAVGQAVPERLRSFHALTRARRSHRDYLGLALGRDELDALLHTACGVTGTMPWAGREAKLRAYPASGALYAVEIYPVVFRVEGLDPAVYHYRAVDNVLEVVKPAIDRARIIGAALPVERQMVAGTAAMICLTGFFPRHERKYGEGGYRMMVAEAGHISQNLILAATALGLSARPFGGVFDDLLNHDLALDGAEEQFLLAVLVGHTGGRGGQDRAVPMT
jgi:SagB-type dehydrogenase family enzyme